MEEDQQWQDRTPHRWCAACGQELDRIGVRAAGHELFFYSKSEAEGSAERMEIDFLLARSRTERNGNISPVEVKSSRQYTTTSLTRYRRSFARYLDTSYVLHTKDLRVDDAGIVHLPLYMAPFLVSRP